MKASDYIVEYLIRKGITDVFGYPGGMVTQLMDSFARYSVRIAAHVTYHEQGAAFAACGYAQVSGKPGVAYATSGPGATNLITGICNAYFDSIPTVFITGQVNTNESKSGYGVRQRGFQETDIVSMVKPVTKYAAYVESPEKLPEYLDRAFTEAESGRMGPALLDIPMNIFRSEIYPQSTADSVKTISEDPSITKILTDALSCSERPCLIIGNGVKITNTGKQIRNFLEKYQIPAVTSMIAFDVLGNTSLNYGFLGAYGTRTANFIAAKSDLIISIGSRLDIRQVGAKRENFAPNARIIRFDVDRNELSYPVHQDETQICTDMDSLMVSLENIAPTQNYGQWIKVCDKIRSILENTDQNPISQMMNTLSKAVPRDAVITTDVGQNQVWTAQSFLLKEGQKVLFSGGHGAMGYALPAAIGACYACGKAPVYCITGDGGMQMNIQELQFIAREHLPVKIIVLNNNALGMIRHFQEMYFEGRYYQTKPQGGYTAPSFSKIADVYGIPSQAASFENISDIFDEISTCFTDKEPYLLEVLIDRDTYVTPKLEFGKPNQDQEPLLDRPIYNSIMSL